MKPSKPKKTRLTQARGLRVIAALRARKFDSSTLYGLTEEDLALNLNMDIADVRTVIKLAWAEGLIEPAGGWAYKFPTTSGE